MIHDLDQRLREGQRLKSEGVPLEGILRFFRADGTSITDCIKLLIRLENVSLGEAKRIVHLSETWADLRVASEELHEDAERAARELGAQISSGSFGDADE